MVVPAGNIALLKCGEVLLENAQTSCTNETQTCTLDISKAVKISCQLNYSKMLLD